MALTKFLVYWVEENNWSICSQSALRDDVAPGKRTFTKYQGKWYPSLVIAKGDQKAIDKVEKSFSIFVNNCLQEESPKDVEDCILKYIHAGQEVVEVQSHDEPSPSSHLASYPSTLVPSKQKESKVVEAQLHVEPSTSSSDLASCSTHIPFVTIGDTSMESQDSPVSMSRESTSERRIRKLEDDTKYLKRKLRKMEERLEKYTGKKIEDMIVEKKVNMDKEIEKKMDTIETDLEGKK